MNRSDKGCSDLKFRFKLELQCYISNFVFNLLGENNGNPEFPLAGHDLARSLLVRGQDTDVNRKGTTALSQKENDTW